MNINSLSTFSKKINIITRLRGPPSPSTKKIAQKTMKTTKSAKSFQNKKNERSNSKNKNIEIKNTPQKKKILNPDKKYTMFTSLEPSNIMLVSIRPIQGSIINEAFKQKKNLIEFQENIKDETALMKFEFDKIYNEAHSIENIYEENIKNNITNLFNGKNFCNIFFGPISGGKSFLLRGGEINKKIEPGILARSIKDIFNLIDLRKQANSNIKNLKYIVKFSAYQIYLDNINDLLSIDNNLIKIEQYYENNKINTILTGLTEAEIKNKSEYDNCIREALYNRGNLSQKLKVNDIKRKSHFIITIKLFCQKDKNIEKFSQVDFVELASSNFGLQDKNNIPINENLFIDTNLVFSLLLENIICAAKNISPSKNCKLTETLKNTLNNDSNIVFINCITPFENPLSYSLDAVQFSSCLFNEINLIQTANSTQRQIIQSIESPSNKRNDAYANNENNIKVISNSYENSFENNNNNMINIDVNNYEEQMGNLNKYPNYNINNSVANSDVYLPQMLVQENDTSFNNNNNYKTNIIPNNRKLIINENNRINNEILNNINNSYSKTTKNGDHETTASDKMEKINRSKSNTNLDITTINDDNDQLMKQIRENSRKKYQLSDNGNPMQSLNNPQNIPSHNENYNNISYNNNRNLSQQDMKIKKIENTLKNLQDKVLNMTQKIEESVTARDENNMSTLNANNNIMNYTTPNINQNLNLSYLPDGEVEKIKQEMATLKSDNIIFREDINRLTDINHHLENELLEQRNRNIELANDNERLTQEKNQIETSLKEAKDALSQNKLNEKNLEISFNDRLMLQNKITDTEANLKKVTEEKSKFEIDYRVLKARYDELYASNEKLNCDYQNIKNLQNDEFQKIEEKVEQLMKEIEKLQNENSDLRKDNERQRIEISALSAQKDSYKEKYGEQKNKNDLLTGKVFEIENEFKNLRKNKDDEDYQCQKYKSDEHKKNKSENKTRIVSELQAKIQNYRNQRLRQREEDN